MPTDFWPLRSLRLVTPRLTLRQPDETELTALAEVAARGVHAPHERPFLTPRTSLPPQGRGLYVMQPHWEARGTWEASAWRLSLCVFRDGEPLGVVGLRAQDFRALREVTTTTWLGVEHHGRG